MGILDNMSETLTMAREFAYRLDPNKHFTSLYKALETSSKNMKIEENDKSEIIIGGVNCGTTLNLNDDNHKVCITKLLIGYYNYTQMMDFVKDMFQEYDEYREANPDVNVDYIIENISAKYGDKETSYKLDLRYLLQHTSLRALLEDSAKVENSILRLVPNIMDLNDILRLVGDVNNPDDENIKLMTENITQLYSNARMRIENLETLKREGKYILTNFSGVLTDDHEATVNEYNLRINKIVVDCENKYHFSQVSPYSDYSNPNSFVRQYEDFMKNTRKEYEEDERIINKCNTIGLNNLNPKQQQKYREATNRVRVNEQQRVPLFNNMVSSDAKTLMAATLLYNALDLQTHGASFAEALEKLEEIGVEQTQMPYSKEQLKQVFSIINGIETLNEMDAVNNDTVRSHFRNETLRFIEQITARYVYPQNGNLPEGKYDRHLLDIELRHIESAIPELNGKLPEVLETSNRINTERIIHEYKLNAYNTNLDPKLKDPKYRAQLHDFYKKKKLIPIKNAQFRKLDLLVDKEYIPKKSMDMENPDKEKEQPKVVPPGPKPTGEVTFKAGLVLMLKREMEALSGAVTKGHMKDHSDTYIGYCGRCNDIYKEAIKLIQGMKNDEEILQYGNQLLGKLNTKGYESDVEFLLANFLPAFNKPMQDYYDEIQKAIKDGNTAKLEQLKIAMDSDRNELGRNSIFPDNANIGLKVALTAVYSASSLMENGKFNLDKINSFQNLPDGTREGPYERADYFKSITEEFAKHIDGLFSTKSGFTENEAEIIKDFFTIKVINGKISIESDIYLDAAGNPAYSNPYDKKKLSTKAPMYDNCKHLRNNSEFYILNGGELQKVDKETFKQSQFADEEVVKISDGKYAPKSQIMKIEEMLRDKVLTKEQQLKQLRDQQNAAIQKESDRILAENLARDVDQSFSIEDVKDIEKTNGNDGKGPPTSGD